MANNVFSFFIESQKGGNAGGENNINVALANGDGRSAHFDGISVAKSSARRRCAGISASTFKTYSQPDVKNIKEYRKAVNAAIVILRDYEYVSIRSLAIIH